MARTKDLYKPSRRKNGEGVGKFCTVNLKEDIAIEFKLLVKAYSEAYGQKMTPTQVIKRLMDAGVKRCDPEVYEAFSRLKEKGVAPEPVLEIIPPVDPTEGEVWNRKYFFEKDGKKIPAEWAKSEKASFSAKINNRYIGVREMKKNGWKLRDDAGNELTEDQAMVIAQKRRKHQEDVEFQRECDIYSQDEEDFRENKQPNKVIIEKDGEQKEVWPWELQEYFDDGWSLYIRSEEEK